MKYLKGKYQPKNIKKYEGDPTQIYHRSSWELSVMLWCDTNPNVIKWSSENVIVPYLSPIDKKIHRYFIDFKIKFKNHKTILVELKPYNQTQEPQRKKKITKKYLEEFLTYVKNKAKWKSANEYALDKNYEFQIWTEKTLKNLNIPILTKLSKS